MVTAPFLEMTGMREEGKNECVIPSHLMFSRLVREVKLVRELGFILL